MFRRSVWIFTNLVRVIFLIILGYLNCNYVISLLKKKEKSTQVENSCSNFLVNVLARLIYGEISQLRESVISKMHNFCLNNCWWNFWTKYYSFLNDMWNIDENSFWRNFCREIFFDKILKVIFFSSFQYIGRNTFFRP